MMDRQRQGKYYDNIRLEKFWKALKISRNTTGSKPRLEPDITPNCCFTNLLEVDARLETLES
jgi:hypothetical protein